MSQDAVGAKVSDVCARWEGTPYMRGQRMRGVAVDCANFVCAALEELGDYGPPAPPETPPALLGAPARAEWHIAAMMRRYPHDRLRHDSAIEAGDVVFVADGGGAADHVLLAASPIVWWHAIPGAGVCRAGLASYPGLIERVFRPKEKHRWIK